MRDVQTAQVAEVAPWAPWLDTRVWMQRRGLFREPLEREALRRAVSEQLLHGAAAVAGGALPDADHPTRHVAPQVVETCAHVISVAGVAHWGTGTHDTREGAPPTRLGRRSCAHGRPPHVDGRPGLVAPLGHRGFGALLEQGRHAGELVRGQSPRGTGRGGGGGGLPGHPFAPTSSTD
jgi:hypothetical protein